MILNFSTVCYYARLSKISTLSWVACEKDNFAGVFDGRVLFQQIHSLGNEKVIPRVCSETAIYPIGTIIFTPVDTEGIYWSAQAVNNLRQHEASGNMMHPGQSRASCKWLLNAPLTSHLYSRETTHLEAEPRH